jgi:hypothetical protein
MIIKNGADFPKIGGVRKDFFQRALSGQHGLHCIAA